MTTSINRKYIIIPIIYAAVLAVLFVIQFSGKSTVTETIGALKITAYAHSGGNGGNRAVDRITLEHPAIAFDFSRDSTLRITTELGRTVRAGIRDFSIRDNGADLRFDEGISIEITVSPKGEGFILSPGFEDITGIETLEIPYRFPDTAAVETASGLPAARISGAENDYFAALPRKGSIDGGEAVFLIPVAAADPGSIRIDLLEESGRGLYAAWFSRQNRLISDQEYRRRIDEFRDKAYLGWTEGRFRGADGWLYPSGQVGFLEETLLGAASEAVRRLDPGAYDSLIEAAGENTGSLSFRSSVYLGDLRAANSTIAEEGWGPETLREAVRALPEDITTLDLSVPEGVDILGVYSETIRRFGEAPVALSPLRKIVEGVIYPAIAVTSEGLFLETEPGICTASVSLEAGRILETIGRHEGDETLTAVGRELVATQISAADEFGFCPGGYTLGEESAEPGSMPLITAEAVYEAAFPELLFPQWMPLTEGFGSETFLFTGVPVRIDSTEGTARMVFSFFPGRSHFLIVRGIEDLEGIVLYDLNWRSDPQFDIYTTGYVYDEAADSVLIKLGHRSDQTEEPVTVSY